MELESSSSANLSTFDPYPDDTDDSKTTNVPPKPKRKNTNIYRNKWEEEVNWLTHSRKGDRYAFCKICNKDLACSEGGLKDIKGMAVQRATFA